MSQPEHIIRFPTPLRRVLIAGTPEPSRTFTEEEFEAACREAKQRGADEAMALIERQMLDLRADVQHLQSRTFTELAEAHATLVSQFRALLPKLAAEAASRVVAGTPLSQDMVLGIVGEMLQNIELGSPDLEVRLSPADLELIAGHESDFREKHPSIIFRADGDLKRGDCIVQSRFGMLDGRIATKLQICKEALHAA